MITASIVEVGPTRNAVQIATPKIQVYRVTIDDSEPAIGCLWDDPSKANRWGYYGLLLTHEQATALRDRLDELISIGGQDGSI